MDLGDFFGPFMKKEAHCHINIMLGLDYGNYPAQE
jgi:hypothetical protein